MRYVLVILTFITLSACTEERLYLRGSLGGVENYLFHFGEPVDFELDHNGDGVVIFRNGKVVSNSAHLEIDDRFSYGVQRIRIAAYRGSDTANQYFRMTLVPKEAPRPLTYEIVGTYPHPKELFTQGLVLDGNTVIESSGQYGQSALSTYPLGSTSFIQQRSVSKDWFAEGLALLGDTLYQITWQEQEAQKYYWDGSRFEPTETLRYSMREGWGVAPWGDELIWSDGSEKIRFINPVDFSVNRTMSVTSNIGLFSNLNELEIYKGRIAANLWQTDRIAFINPEDGSVDRVLDLNDIADRHNQDGTLNGIMVRGDNLIITGKNWPTMYELKINWE